MRKLCAVFFTASFLLLFSMTAGRKPSETDVKKLSETPSFDLTTPVNVSVQYGGHAYMVCKVHNVGNKSVSWVRKQDGSLLAVDSDTFISDSRFQVLHGVSSDTWTLHIRGAKASDAGHYECQVSTEHKQSLVFHLSVSVPQVEIRGSPDIYVMSSSSVMLHCVISGLTDYPPFVLWYHNGRRIAGSALEPAAADLTTSTHQPDANGRDPWSARVIRLGKDSLLASLHIQSATSLLAGNYTCSPPSLNSARATLHVLHGEQPAAMQHGKNSAVSVEGLWITVLLALEFLLSVKV